MTTAVVAGLGRGKVLPEPGQEGLVPKFPRETPGAESFRLLPAPGVLQSLSLSGAVFRPGMEGPSLPHLGPDLGPGTLASAGFEKHCWHVDPTSRPSGKAGGERKPPLKGCLFSFGLERVA